MSPLRGASDVSAGYRPATRIIHRIGSGHRDTRRGTERRRVRIVGRTRRRISNLEPPLRARVSARRRPPCTQHSLKARPFNCSHKKAAGILCPTPYAVLLHSGSLQIAEPTDRSGILTPVLRDFESHLMRTKEYDHRFLLPQYFLTMCIRLLGLFSK